MSGSPTISLANLSAAIETLQSNIDHVNQVTEQAIQFLEDKKRELRTTADPNLKQVEANIDHITLEHDKIIEKLLKQKTDVSLRKESIDKLDYAIEELDREISRIQCERDIKIDELLRKKSYIIQRLHSIQDLNLLVSNISTQIYATAHDFQAAMEEAINRRQEILDNPDITDSEKALMLGKLDTDIADMRKSHTDYIDSLKRQRDESLSKIREIDVDAGTAYQVKLNIQDELNRLEASKRGATASELEVINRKIKILQRQQEEVDFIRNLDERGLKMSQSGHIITGSGRIFTIAEAEKAGLLAGMDVSQWLAREQIKDRGLDVTASGNIRTESGKIISLDEALRRGLLEGINVQTLIDGDKESTAPTISAEDINEELASEDVEYLKNVLGKPLTLALAEICAKKPRDPIHYLGHWLFKYRYNQEIDDARKKEIEELIEERDRLRKETWHKEIETAAKQTVLEMAFKAYDKALKQELDEIAKEQQMMEAENDELAEEAKDTLGELASIGPKVT